MPTRILAERCSNCSICVFQCGGWVYDISLNNSQPVVSVARAKDCVDCCLCMELCPEEAIELYFKGEAFSLGESTQKRGT